MGNEIVINVSREETRVAVLENRSLAELYIDRRKDQGVVGNIYKGRVTKVLPGMQAAFVDIGMERAAFLYVDEITPRMHEFKAAPEEEEEEEPLPESLRSQEEDDDLPGGPRALEVFRELDEDNPDAEPSREEDEKDEPSLGRSLLQSGDKTPGRGKQTQSRRFASRKIEDILSEGQEVMVQVTKAPMGTKGPRVTTYISLPGRHLVFMPSVNHVGVSRRIGKDHERNRLKKLIYKYRKPRTGYIARTVSAGVTDADVKGDMNFLELVWQETLKKKESLPAPAMLHNDLDLVFRTIRDLFTKKIEKVIVDSKAEFTKIQEFVTTFMPDLASRVELYDRTEPLFEYMQIEVEISKALSPKVWLKSGGYIIIEHTEALTVIDVNTGRFVGKRHLEDTIFKTNLEAAKEIAEQLRLRNIGGIIVTDFIDMETEKNREKVYNTFNQALSKDRARTRIYRISDLGLIEMSRERTRESILRVLCEPCTYCEGRGYTKSPESVCFEIFREIQQVGISGKHKKILVSVHPRVANLMYDEERMSVEDLEKKYQKKLIIKADSNHHIEQYDIVPL